MLTKAEILRKMNGFECPEYLVTPCWQPIYDQCVAAIDLAAENERLKAELAEYIETFEEQNRSLGDSIIECDQLRAKLDAVKEECYKTIAFNGEVGETQEARHILAIIKDGDDT